MKCPRGGGGANYKSWGSFENVTPDKWGTTLNNQCNSWVCDLHNDWQNFLSNLFSLNYRTQTKFAKVILLQVSVCPGGVRGRGWGGRDVWQRGACVARTLPPGRYYDGDTVKGRVACILLEWILVKQWNLIILHKPTVYKSRKSIFSGLNELVLLRHASSWVGFFFYLIVFKTKGTFHPCFVWRLPPFRA